MIVIILFSCKSETKEDIIKIVTKPKVAQKIKISSKEKNLIYDLDANTIVVNGDTIRIESPFIYSFDGLIENKKIQVHLTNMLTGEYGEYQKSASIYIEGENEIFGCYFEKDKQNNYKPATVTDYYAGENRNKEICKLKMFSISKQNMYLDCTYNGKVYKLNPSTVFPSYKCFDEINYSLSDCKIEFEKGDAMRKYVPHRNYTFLAEIISNTEKYDKIENELKYLFTDSLDVKNYKKWKHEFQIDGSKLEEDCYSSETLSNVSPVFIDDNIFTTSSYSYTYLGGAHGMMVTDYQNYNLESGKIIDLNEILNIGSLEFKAFYEKEIKETFADGILSENEIPMSNKFFILPTGIVFSYAPYELLGFAAGEPHIFFSFKDLEPFIANNSILEKYLMEK